MANTTFPNWLRIKLREHGWTQAELARRSGISPAHITKALNGERSFGEQSLLAIAQALKLPPDEVFRVAGLLPPETQQSERVSRITYLLKMLNDEDLEDLEDLARAKLQRIKDKTPKTKQKYQSRKNPARNVLKGE